MFRRSLFLALSLVGSVVASPEAIQKYLEYCRNYPLSFGEKGDWQQGEIETVADYEQMCEIESQFAMRYFNKGIPLKEALERSRLGVVSEDGFWVWVREPLLFPDGSCDIYNRFVHKNSLKTPPGVEGTVAAVLALTYGEKIVLNVIFRNATRSWEIELPRGGREPLESAEDAARREAKEETGCEIEEIVHLGTFPIDSAVIRDFYHVFFAKVAALGDTDRENSEVIGSILTLTKEEAKDALCEGKLEVEVQGRKVMAHCRDHSLAYAILLAESKGLL